MKKLTLSLLIVALSITLTPIQLFARIENTTFTMPAPKQAEQNEANALLSRLKEINAMDKSKLNFTEKRVLRKEVNAASKRLHEIGHGVYISVGAIIIIVLLLIILL